MKVLYIQSSPRGERSHSTHVAQAFLSEYSSKHPDTEIITRNVFEMGLPEFDNTLVAGKYDIMHGRKHSDALRDAWASVEQLIEEFKSADKYVFSVPMWNFSIPYKLKQYIDIVAQPGYTFAVGENGYTGLVKGQAFIAYSRGGAYPVGSDADAINFQSKYLEFQLGFFGIDIIETVSAEQMMSPPENRDRIKAEVIGQAIDIAGKF
ncbi:MAG: FMN-dependent NADH-azoreductase [Desulfovibrio sp.]